MDALPDKLQRQTILPILRKSTRPLINTAKSKLLSHGQNYSSLAKSIGNIPAKSKNAIIYVGPRVKGKWKYIGYYAAWVEYGVKGIFVGVPVVLGRKGVEKIIEIHLSEKESIAFKCSVEHIKERTDDLNEKRKNL